MKPGRILFSDGDPLERLYYISEGYVKLYRLSSRGKETICYLYGPGYVVGLRALLSKDKVAKHSAETLTNVRLLTITHNEYFSILSKYPAFIIDLTHYFMDRLESTERVIEGFVATNTVTRVAYFFSDFVVRFCDTKKKKEIELPLTFTHQRIAEFIGSTRETVTMAIQKLEKEGILVVKRRKVTIRSLTKLHKYTNLS